MTDSVCTTNPAVNQEEEWRDIPGYPGYQVSDLGNMRSSFKKKTMKLVHPVVSQKYRVFRFPFNGKKMGRKVSHLVLFAFVGERPPGMQCCHNNGICTDDRLVNLRWDTQYANIQDKAKHGVNTVGERNPKAKISNQDAVDIRTGHQNGIPIRDLCSKYGIKYDQMRRIILGEMFKCAGGPIGEIHQAKDVFVLQGENQPRAKLKDSDIPKILELVKNKVTAKTISSIFGVHMNTIYNIKHGNRWKHIPR